MVLDLFLLKPNVYFHLLYNLNHAFQSSNSHFASSNDPPKLLPRIRSVQHDPSFKIFPGFHLKFSFLIYCLLLILESTFQALDYSTTGHNLLDPKQPKQILHKLIGLTIHIGNVTLTAIMISKFKKSNNLDSIKNTTLNSIQALIISMLPGIVLYFTIMIFQNSYGTRTPTPLFTTLDENEFFRSNIIVKFIENRFGIEPSILDVLVGLDMDQIGSPKLKKFLIQYLLGNLSSSVAITVPLLQTWSFGFVVLAWSSIQQSLFSYVFHQATSLKSC